MLFLNHRSMPKLHFPPTKFSTSFALPLQASYINNRRGADIHPIQSGASSVHDNDPSCPSGSSRSKHINNSL